MCPLEREPLFTGKSFFGSEEKEGDIGDVDVKVLIQNLIVEMVSRGYS